MIDGQNLGKYNLGKYDNIRKMAVDQGDVYTAGCLLNYTYFKECYKIIEIEVNGKHLILIQKQYTKLILPQLYIEIEMQQCFSLLKK